MSRLRRGMIAADGNGWAVEDYDGEPLFGRWATEEEAREQGLLGVYLLSGSEVVHVGPKPGDLCRLLGDGLVEHVAPCRDHYATGTITNVRTGKVVTP